LASVVPNSEATQFKSGEDAVEKGHNGGIRSGEVRREKAQLKKELEMMLKSTDDGQTYSNKITLGLIANAIDKNIGGNPKSYELIARMLGELEAEKEPPVTPELKIEIVNNEELEKEMYE
jgi:hypothetical protein